MKHGGAIADRSAKRKQYLSAASVTLFLVHISEQSRLYQP